MTATRFSPFYDALHAEQSTRGQWTDAHGMAVPLHLAEQTREAETARVLGLAEVSFLPRLVVKGPQAKAFLEVQGVVIPTEVLSIGPLEGGGLVARTGGAEFFLEDGPKGTVIERVDAAIGSQPGVYRVLRQDAALILSGSRAGELLRHACSYDLINEPHHNFVFTQVAGVSCSLLRVELNAIPAFRLWTDGTYGLYIWRTLLEIAAELGGGAVGTAVFYPALREMRQP